MIEQSVRSEQITEQPLFPALTSFFATNRQLLLFLAALGVLVYGYEIFNFNFTEDEELFGHYPPWDWIGQGRYLAWLIAWLILPVSALPVVPTLIALGGMIVATVMALRAWTEGNRNDDLALFLAAALVLTSPVWEFGFAFSISFLGGVALAFSVFASVVAARTGGRAALVGTLLLTLAVLFSQSTLAVAPTIWFGGLLLRVARSQNRDRVLWIKETLRFFAMLTVAVGIYMSLTILVVKLTGADTSYAEGHLALGALLEPWLYAKMVGYVTAVLLGFADFYLDVHWSHALLTLLTGAVVLIAIFKGGQDRQTMTFGVAVLGAVMLTPFAMHFIAGGWLPTRTLVALPFALAAVFLAAWGMLTARWQRQALAILVALVVLHNAALINRLSVAQQFGLAIDQYIALEIGQLVPRLLQQQGVSTSRPLSLAVIGRFEREGHPPALIHNVFGMSFFWAAWGSSERVAEFLRVMGLPIRGVVPIEQLPIALKVQETMPVWPLEGSVAIVDDLLIVKFGPPNPVQQYRICLLGSTPEQCASPARE